MVIGPFINAGAVLLGGVLGAVLSQRLPERIRSSMPSIFGLASLGIGVLLVIKCANLPVMVLATLLGALIGEFYRCWRLAAAGNRFAHLRDKDVCGGEYAARAGARHAAFRPVDPLFCLSGQQTGERVCSL